MTLSIQEKENLTTLSYLVLRGDKEGLPEETIAERYAVMRSGIVDCGSELLTICDLYDQPGSRVDGAGLILMLSYQPPYRGPIPEDLPEGRGVIHKEFGSGVVIVNKTAKTESPANSMWGRGDDLRMIAVDFSHGVEYVNPEEEFWIISLEEEQVAA